MLQSLHNQTVKSCTKEFLEIKSFKNDTVFHNAIVTATTEVTIVTSFGTKKI
jgi:hypothetical protein